MIILQGKYLDGIYPVEQEATLAIENEEATFSGETFKKAFPIAQLAVSPAVGGAKRFISLPDQSKFLCKNSAILSHLPQVSPSEGLIYWLENRWWVALAAIVLIVALAIFTKIELLPRISEKIVNNITIENEKSLGTEMLKAMDSWILAPSQLEPEQKNWIQLNFEFLLKHVPNGRETYKIEIRSSKYLGPNAFALPGGTIVVTDDMFKVAYADDEFAAILAHEIGHQELRHPLKSLLSGSFVALAAGGITHDASTVGGAFAELPLAMIELKFSRDFEREADTFAFQLLKKRGFSPLSFKNALERIKGHYEIQGRDTKGSSAFLSSHPLTDDRIKAAEKSAAETSTRSDFTEEKL